MPIIFSSVAWEDYQYWLKHDKKMLERLHKLIKESLRNPFEGIGKPEPLKSNVQGLWSRRINDEHRLIYEYNDGLFQSSPVVIIINLNLNPLRHYSR